MKKLSLCIITALSLVSLGILTACGVSATPKEAGSAQLPNPFIPCASIEDANEILGFTAAVPSILPDGYETAAIAAVSSSDPAFVKWGKDYHLPHRKRLRQYQRRLQLLRIHKNTGSG